jgi:hypothetical protein
MFVRKLLLPRSTTTSFSTWYTWSGCVWPARSTLHSSRMRSVTMTPSLLADAPLSPLSMLPQVSRFWQP